MGGRTGYRPAVLLLALLLSAASQSLASEEDGGDPDPDGDDLECCLVPSTDPATKEECASMGNNDVCGDISDFVGAGYLELYFCALPCERQPLSICNG